MKKIVASLFLFFSVLGFAYAQPAGMTSILSSHILDISAGLPAAEVTIVLEKKENDVWVKVDEQMTNKDGRANFMQRSADITTSQKGVYRLTFETKPYFDQKKEDSFYPFITVVFEITNDAAHYHVPITLSPFGYSTYRGS